MHHALAHTGLTLMLVGLALNVGCGGEDPKPEIPDAGVDAVVQPPPPPDATPQASVKPVSCLNAPIALKVKILDGPYRFGFEPDPGDAVPSVPRGSIVMFDMPRNHNAVSGTVATGDDGRFTVPTFTTVCFQVPDPGRISFYCEHHDEEAAFTVQ